LVYLLSFLALLALLLERFLHTQQNKSCAIKLQVHLGGKAEREREKQKETEKMLFTLIHDKHSQAQSICHLSEGGKEILEEIHEESSGY
jgi:hypothetical protein